MPHQFALLRLCSPPQGKTPDIIQAGRKWRVQISFTYPLSFSFPFQDLAGTSTENPVIAAAHFWPDLNKILKQFIVSGIMEMVRFSIRQEPFRKLVPKTSTLLEHSTRTWRTLPIPQVEQMMWYCNKDCFLWECAVDLQRFLLPYLGSLNSGNAKLI